MNTVRLQFCSFLKSTKPNSLNVAPVMWEHYSIRCKLFKMDSSLKKQNQLSSHVLFIMLCDLKLNNMVSVGSIECDKYPAVLMAVFPLKLSRYMLLVLNIMCKWISRANLFSLL